MFGKLIKHEMRASGRIMLPLLIAMPGLGLLSNLAVRLIDSDSGLLRIISGLILFIFGTGCLCLSFASFVVMILRWYRSVHSAEGYLTNTLPVSVHGIIWSRLLTAAIYLILSVSVLVLSVALMDLSRELFVKAKEFMAMLMQIRMDEFERELLKLGLCAAGLGILYAIAKCLHFYAAISVGHAFNDRKSLMSVVAYVVMQIIVMMTTVYSAQLVTKIPGVNLDSPRSASLFLLCGAIGIILYGAVCYFITVFAVEKKLNLE